MKAVSAIEVHSHRGVLAFSAPDPKALHYFYTHRTKVNAVSNPCVLHVFRARNFSTRALWRYVMFVTANMRVHACLSGMQARFIANRYRVLYISLRYVRWRTRTRRREYSCEYVAFLNNGHHFAIHYKTKKISEPERGVIICAVIERISFRESLLFCENKKAHK